MVLVQYSIQKPEHLSFAQCMFRSENNTQQTRRESSLYRKHIKIAKMDSKTFEMTFVEKKLGG